MGQVVELAGQINLVALQTRMANRLRHFLLIAIPLSGVDMPVADA
jgi:hypothetical protein